MSNNKFESLLDLLINEENDKAEALFHEIVVEKSRDIYEGLAEEATVATKEETKDEAVKETEKETKDEAVKETEETKDEAKVEETTEEAKDEEVKETEAKDEVKDEAIETTEEESIEEVGGDATDELVKDISADQDGDAEIPGEEIPGDPEADAENGEEGDVEDRVVDLEDALDELKAEFEAMMAGKDGEVSPEEESIMPVIPAQETQPEMARVETKDSKEGAKETVKEYKNPVKADMSGGDDKSAKSPVSSGPKVKSAATGVKTGSGAADTGRAAPSTGNIKSGDFENTGGKAKSTSFKKQEKANTADGSDKSAKSPVASK
jgi:hypothetical protein